MENGLKPTKYEGKSPNEGVDSPFQKNKILLDIYRIVSDEDLGGGCGQVFRVHHLEWDVDLAMKQPKREMFLTEKHKRTFKNECENWINLGFHPHIVTCYYVRDIDGIPTIFSEWMEGGSLRNWIYSNDGQRYGELYKGIDDDDETKKKEAIHLALKNILDISIQIARGLHYAHEKGLIHRDVKPENLLLTVEGEVKVFTAKVADFGIAFARESLASIGTDTELPKGKKASINSYYTLQYRSPEQKEGGDITFRTDIWSWAVTVLEMFTGECLWQDGDGAEVGDYCEMYFEMAKIPVPEAMKVLLRHCFQKNEADRPYDFETIEATLLKIYQTETGSIYPLPKPKAANLNADTLNNRALSYIDLKEKAEAEKCWEEALKIDSDHLDSIYNKTVHLWRDAQIDDDQAFIIIKSMYENNQNNFRTLWLYMNFCIERHDYYTAAVLFDENRESFRNILPYKHYQATVNPLLARNIWYSAARPISDKFSYTGLFRVTDNGNAVVSCSWKGVEKWKLISNKGVPESANCIYKYEWPKEQIKVLAMSNDGRYILTLAGKEKANASEIKKSRIPLSKDTFATILFNDLNQREQDQYHASSNYRDSLIETFSYDHYCLFSDEYKHLTNGNAIYLWLEEKKDCLCKFKSDLFKNDQPKAACFSPDNQQVMTLAWTNGEDNHGKLETWEIKTGKKTQSVIIHEKGVTAVAFSPDKKQLLTGNENGEVKLFDTRSGELIKIINEVDAKKIIHRILSTALQSTLSDYEMGPDIITGVYFTPDARHVCAVGSKGSYSQWEIDSGQIKYAYQNGFNKHIYFHPDKQYVYSVYGNMRFIDLINGRCIRTALHFPPAHIEFLPDTKYALCTFTANEEATKKGLYLIDVPDFNFKPAVVWSLSKVVTTKDLLEQERLFKQLAEKINDCLTKRNIEEALKYLDEAFNIPYISMTAELQRLNDAVGRYCRIKKVHSISRIKTADSFKKTENYYTFSPEGYIIDNGKCYDIVNDRYACTVEKRLMRYVFSPDNSFVYGTIADPSEKQRQIMAFDVQTGKYLFTFDGNHAGTVNSVTVSYDGRYLLTGSDDMTAKLWDIGQRKCTRVFAHKKGVKNAHFGPELLSVVTISSHFATLHGDVILWTVQSAEQYLLHKDACNICPNYNSTMLLIGVKDGIEKFNLDNRSFIGKCKTEEVSGIECIIKIRLLPDERFALSISSAGKIGYWNLASGKCVSSFQGKGINMDLHPSGNYALSYLDENCLVRIEHQYIFPGWQDWDEGARPYLEHFLALHPSWTNQDFENILIPDLQNRGYGWLDPKGVNEKLKSISKRNEGYKTVTEVGKFKSVAKRLMAYLFFGNAQK